MAVPPPLHYWLVRLRALNRPMIWGGGLGLLLLGLVGQQYFSHPEWLRGFVPNDEDPARPADDLSNLSQADLANLAEIDNLGLLLNQMQPRTASALAETPDSSPEAATTPGTPRPDASDPNPFAAYLERTQFRVSAPTPEGTNSTSAGGQSALSRPRFEPPTASETPALDNPLQQLLAPAQPNTASAENPTRSESAEATSTDERLNPGEPTGLTPPPWVVEGRVPGVNQPFIRTTPEMSPPPGTTGYRSPSSLAPSPQPSPNLGLPAPAAAPLNLAPGTTAPSGSLAAPSPSGMGSTLPPSGLSGYTAPPTAGPEAAPFSAPRPPGSRAGGGYIYTFSDPNGPGD